MGQLVEGQWREERVDTTEVDGRFVRSQTRFRGKIEDCDDAEFPSEAGRYHLYVSHACPWAHRTLLMRRLKRLDDVISVSVVDPYMGPEGWSFSDREGCGPDEVNGARYLHEIYTRADPRFTGRVTVPVLWDKRKGTIVSNESADIIRLFNDAFPRFTKGTPDLYPDALRPEIERWNGRIYPAVNDGVYRTGFASTQAAYEDSFRTLFQALAELDEHLASRRFLCGATLTEADIRLWTTLVRFDAVYLTHFKCNERRLTEFPHLWDYTRDLYQWPGVKETVFLDHIKEHYFLSHPTLNPKGIVPLGPRVDLDAPHRRHELI
ncbi:MAG: glutathione S-transferase family protein [Myxococcota bacterium]